MWYNKDKGVSIINELAEVMEEFKKREAELQG